MNVDEIRKINRNIVKENGNLMSFKEQMFDLLVGNFEFNNAMVINDNSKSLEYAGIDPNKVITINPNKILSIHKEHNISYAKLAELQDILNKSPLAFDSLTQKTSKVIVLNEKDSYGDIMIAICRFDAENREIDVNQISSIYGKKNFERFIERTYEEEKSFYLNEKTERFLQIEGLQLPNEMKNSLLESNYTGIINKNQEHLYNSIKFKGYTFIELHKFSEKESTLKNISNLYTYKEPLNISYDEFYSNTKSTYDLFYCPQTNNIYLPTIHGFMKVINERVNGLELSKAAKETLKEHNYLDKDSSSNDKSNFFRKCPEVSIKKI